MERLKAIFKTMGQWLKRMWAAYRAFMARRAERKRLERERKWKQELARRKEQHEKLMATLADEFNVMIYDLTDFIESRPSHERSAMVNKYAGQAGGASIIDTSVSAFRRGSVEGGLMSGGNCVIARTVADLHPKEVAVLRLISHLHQEGQVDNAFRDRLLRAIVYNNGQCTFQPKPREDGKPRKMDASGQRIAAAVQELTAFATPPAQMAINEAIGVLGDIKNGQDDPELAALIDRELKGHTGWQPATALN